MVSSVMAAVTSPDTWVRAPTMRFTAVWLMPPPAGIDPNNAPAAFAAPVASSSVLGRGAGSPGATNARPTAAVSVKLMSAMPSAAGQSSSRETSRAPDPES